MAKVLNIKAGLDSGFSDILFQIKRFIWDIFLETRKVRVKFLGLFIILTLNE
jgi:hypothetical protein